ncbi:MAG: hypothetical protein ACM3ZC_11435 [Bacteroidota bacterium]
MRFGRFRLRDLALAVVFGAIAIRAATAALPVPLGTEPRQVHITFFIKDVSAGLLGALPPGETVRHAKNGAALGRIISAQSRPAREPASGRHWSEALDVLAVVAGKGRFRAGKGLYLGRNLPVRVGESYPLRTTLASFWGRVERIKVAGGR